MAQLMEYAEYLSKEIGPRPAGTEEEQQAALYITECFQKDAGFSAQIEEFTSSSNVEWLRAVPGLVVIVVAILAMVFPMLSIPAFILAAASAALYTLEAFGHPIVTRALARGASQNVVAKYQPNSEEKTARGRSRKIVLVARYDSDKVTPGLVRTVESIKLPVPIGLVCVCGMVLAAFFLLLHIFINFGIGGLVINVLTVISLIVCAYPVVRTALFRAAPYNEGANNNASGTAAIMEVARRISRGSVSEADLSEDPSAYGVNIHGEQAAYESGYIPEGAQILYEAENLVPPSEIGEYNAEESLLAAKAAIAAMTGQPVERRVFGSVATNLVNSRAQGDDPVVESAFTQSTAAQAEEQPSFAAEAPQATPSVKAPAQDEQPVAATVQAPVYEGPAADEDFKNAPSWFVSARQNAKKPAGDTGPVQRSRYTEAIETAEREAAERERLQREAELKMREQQARAAIQQNAQEAFEAQPEPMPAPEPAPAPEPEPAPAPAPEPERQPEAIEPPELFETPVFVPYAEAQAKSGPSDDAFAASLGETAAFDPRMIQDRLPEVEDTPQPARLVDLPSVEAAEPAPVIEENTSPSRSGMFRKLRADVPSMSGVIRMQQAGEDVSQLPAQRPMQRPVVVGSVEPLREELPPIAAPASPAETEAIRYDEEPEDEYYEDEEDAYYEDEEGVYYEDDYEEPYDEPVQPEMPKSRAGGFFSRFRRNKNEELSETPQEWLDVDDDFDARTVGRERGGWESFRDDSLDDYPDEPQNGRRWEGGAFSRVRLGRVDTRSGEETGADEPSEPVEIEEDRQIADEIEQIYHFRNPLYNTEIWFVALGSEGDAHDGTKAFLAEHGDDLRGAMVIEVESLGVGELCTASKEGRVRQVAASSRVKRYTRAATSATGIAPGTVDLTGSDSAASIVQAAGHQAMHLVGVEDGKPSLKGSPDDIYENIDDLLLDDNVNFIMELLKK